MHDFSQGWLVAIDPGTANMGVAVFYGGVLVSSRYFQRPTHKVVRSWIAGALRNCTNAEPVYWVREKMTQYRRRGDAHKNLKRIEEFMRLFTFHETYTPRVWKGTVPKHIHHQRIEAVLTPAERVLWKTMNSDERDATGIGLFALGRIQRGGIAGRP